jgi:hypothetical protein
MMDLKEVAKRHWQYTSLSDHGQKAIFKDKDLSGLTFPDSQFIGASFENCIFDGSDLTEADLSHAKFINCSLKNVTLSVAAHTYFKNCMFEGSQLQNTNFYNVRFCNVNATHVDFTGSIMRRAQLVQCNFTGANLDGVDLLDSHVELCVFPQKYVKGKE